MKINFLTHMTIPLTVLKGKKILSVMRIVNIHMITS